MALAPLLPKSELRRLVSGETGYGDASACLMLRIPVIRRSPLGHTSNRMPPKSREFATKPSSGG
jgi:hypothetical protein